MAMTSSTIKTFTTVQTGEVDVYRVVQDGTVYVTEQNDRWDVDLDTATDFCGVSRLEQKVGVYGDYHWEVTPHCEHCDTGNGQRVAESLGRGDEHGEDSDAVLSTLQRRGVLMAGLESGRYDYHAVRDVSADTDIILVVEGEVGETFDPYGMAKDVLGRFRAWSVGTIPLDDVDDLDDLRPSDCDDVVGGFVWENVDSHGYSSPTEAELLVAL